MLLASWHFYSLYMAAHFQDGQTLVSSNIWFLGLLLVFQLGVPAPLD
jgi:hypothetical protein